MRLLRLLRLSAEHLQSIGRRSRSSRKGWGTQRPLEKSAATREDPFRPGKDVAYPDLAALKLSVEQPEAEPAARLAIRLPPLRKLSRR